MLEVTVKIEGFDEDGNPTADMQSEIIAGVVQRLSSHIEDQVRKEVEGHFKSVIAQKLSSSIEDFLSRPIHPTNQYGEKKGQPKTLIEIIAQGGADYLAESVSERNGGRPDYSDTKIMRAEWIARKMADETLSKELKPVIEKAKTDAKEFMVSKVAKAIKEAMASAIK